MNALLQDIASKSRAKHGAAVKGLGKLPAEMVDTIVDHADWLMSREEAEQNRLDMVNERNALVDYLDQMHFSVSHGTEYW